MSLKYKNISQFYKKIVINGKRTNIPPNGVFETDRELDIEVHDFLTRVESTQPTTINTHKPQEKKKIEVVNHDQYEKLERAILILKDKIPTKEQIYDMISEKIAGLNTDIDPKIFDDITRRQEVLKHAIDEVNNAVVSLEEAVYNENQDFVIVEDEPKSKPVTGPSIEDILNGEK